MVYKDLPNNIDDKIDCIYDNVDYLMRSAEWKILNSLSSAWESNAHNIDLNLLLAFATASLPGKSNIPARAEFIEKCKELYPKPELWKGLE